MKYYVIGEDKSLKEASADVLPLAGGYMTGNIGYDSGVRRGVPIKFLAGDANGSGLVLGDGGVTILASGESGGIVTPENPASERTIVASDTTIEFYVNCQNGATDAVKTTMATNGLLSGHQKAITSGTAAPSGGSNGDIYIQY